jgi:RNA polymerase nonessential primary-like sigma factor
MMNDSLRTYFRTIGRVPLLTQEQEIFYGTQVQAMMSLVAAKETLAQQLHREPTDEEWALQVALSSAELTEMVRCGQRAKCQMVEANLRLVVVLAKRYRERGVEFQDLIQEGAIGLQRAVERFDPTLGFRLSSYATWWIRQALSRAIRDTSRTVRLPPKVYEQLCLIRKVWQQLCQHNGRTPTMAQIASQLKMSPQLLSKYLQWAQPPLSLNQLVKNDGEDELGSLVPDTSATPLELLMQSCATEELQMLMQQLTPQQSEVLSLRFGLVDGQKLTLSEISTRFNVSKQRVHQIALKALAQMKTKITATAELPALEKVAEVSADTMPEAEAGVSDDSAPDIKDIWSAILEGEPICDANAEQLLSLISEQSGDGGQ